MTPISAVTNKPGRPVPLPPGSYPTFTAITPNGRTGYVLSSTDNPELGYVTPVNTATNKALHAIQIAASPARIVFTPNGRTAYVTSDEGVFRFSTATNKPGKPLKIGLFPDGIVITPNGRTAYVTDPVLNRVTPINLVANTALRAIRVGPGPEAGRLTRWLPARPAASAAIAASGLAVVDVAMLAALAILAASMPGRLAPLPVAAAGAASLTRLSFVTRAARNLLSIRTASPPVTG